MVMVLIVPALLEGLSSLFQPARKSKFNRLSLFGSRVSVCLAVSAGKRRGRSLRERLTLAWGGTQ